jgi:hypothetical protein
MSFKAYAIIESSAEKTTQVVRTLHNKPGVVTVDILEDSPRVIMVVEAPERDKLAKLTVQAISSADSMADVIQMLAATSED